MGTATVIFRKCIQDSQEYGSDDEHMVSRIFFDLELDGKQFKDLYVDVKQSVGSRFESFPLEVGTPQGYKGPFNWDAFSDAVDDYYRNLVGARGSGIRIEGATDIRMYNNKFIQEKQVQFEVAGSEAGW